MGLFFITGLYCLEAVCIEIYVFFSEPSKTKIYWLTLFTANILISVVLCLPSFLAFQACYNCVIYYLRNVMSSTGALLHFR